MLSKNIFIKNFKKKKIPEQLKRLYKNLISESLNKQSLLNSFTKSFSYSFNKKKISKFKKYSTFQVYGMGGSSLGAKAIYDFLKHKIKKNFRFIDNLNNNSSKEKKIISI